MRNILLSIVCTVFLGAVHAQDNSMRFFAGSIFEIGLNSQNNATIGGVLGFAEKNYFFGIYGTNTFYDEILVKESSYQKSLGLGGLMIGFTLPSEERAHLFGSLKLGWGEARLSDYYDDNSIRSYKNAVFAINPEIGVEVRVTSWYSFAITANYRLVEGVDNLPSMGDYDFENYGLGVVFRFGNFAY